MAVSCRWAHCLGCDSSHLEAWQRQLWHHSGMANLLNLLLPMFEYVIDTCQGDFILVPRKGDCKSLVLANENIFGRMLHEIELLTLRDLLGS